MMDRRTVHVPKPREGRWCIPWLDKLIEVELKTPPTSQHDAKQTRTSGSPPGDDSEPLSPPGPKTKNILRAESDRSQSSANRKHSRHEVRNAKDVVAREAANMVRILFHITFLRYKDYNGFDSQERVEDIVEPTTILQQVR